MTTLELYRKHKAGEVSREKFLYEVRRDNNLPFITNLTSYDDAVIILKNKGIVTEVDTKEAKADEAVKAEVKAKAPSTKKPKELHIDQANPYEYRHGLQYELEQLDDYSDEALEKAKSTVLKNLAKDVNFYSNLLNAKQSPFTFKATETDAKGMQANADGHLKKELKKDEKANVKDSLGKKEAGKKKPKGIKVMPDKGVTGSEKIIKEGIEVVKYKNCSTCPEKTGKLVKDLGDKLIIFDKEDGLEQTISKDKIIKEGNSKSELYHPHVSKDKNNPNFLNVSIAYPTGEGNLTALGKRTMSGQERDNGAIKAMKIGKEIADKLSSKYNLEDIDVSDNGAGKVTVFAVSDDFIDLPDEFPFKEMNEHHNDPNFPGGTKIHAMLDKVADDWGKDSDLYSDLEDAIIGWSDRNGELSPKGILAIKNLLSNWDILDDYEQFLDNNSSQPEAPKKYAYVDKGDELPAIYRMYNSDAWVQAQKDMKEDLPGMAGGMHGDEDFRRAMGIEDDSPYEDDNFPFGTKIQAMLDKVADEWGRSSDLYSDLEDAIVGWSNVHGELTPKGKIAIRALLSNWDILDDYEQFLSEDLEEANPNYSPEIGSTAYNNAENQFNQLMSKYDWYYEMGDDHRAWERGNAMDKQLKALGKQIGVDKAVALFNDKAPSDRKVTSTFFMEGEDKHAKLKEVLKKKVKEAIAASELIQAKQKGQIVKIPKSATQDIQAAERAKVNFSTYE